MIKSDEIEALARQWYEADQQHLYGHCGHWGQDREGSASYMQAVSRIYPQIEVLVLQESAAPMHSSSVRQRARSLARVAHHGALNSKNGEPYINHPVRVAAYVGQALEMVSGADGEPGSLVALAEAVALLHDTVEDTWVTEDILLDVFPDEPSLVEAVLLLTRLPGAPSEDYYQAIMESPLARLVKVADLIDNTDPVRMAALEDSDRARLRKKYQAAAEALGVAAPLAAWAGWSR